MKYHKRTRRNPPQDIQIKTKYKVNNEIKVIFLSGKSADRQGQKRRTQYFQKKSISD